ncbi:MAG: type II toxin-antitoxin system RelE/ParE family toxin [Planctomycetes bacterium]|nr:type II toxin-antitoxin system RelE/ParE family toxin [Planctomycetota bacterium]
MPHILITPEARKNLDGIWDYIAQDNLPAADKLIDQLWQRFRLLAENPELGELQPLLAEGAFRRHVFGNYGTYYQPRSDGIAAIRVLHGARDQERQF